MESHPLSVDSHPLGVVENGEECCSEHEEIKDEEIEIRVTQAPGYLCHICATATFQLPPDKFLKQCIAHPLNSKIFRGMQRCTYRKILADDGAGRQTVEVAHEESFRFLVFRGSFTTRLIVEQDIDAYAMSFALKPGSSGMMKKFAGSWSVEAHESRPGCCVARLDQDVALAIFVPPPLDRLMKRIVASQVKKVFEDIQAEAKKVAAGQPTLQPWEEVHAMEIGVDKGQG